MRPVVGLGIPGEPGTPGGGGILDGGMIEATDVEMDGDNVVGLSPLDAATLEA